LNFSFNLPLEAFFIAPINVGRYLGSVICLVPGVAEGNMKNRFERNSRLQIIKLFQRF